MLTVEDYQRRLLQAVTRLPSENRPITEIGSLVGSVLDEDVRSAVPLPGFTNSAMDGYAVRAADVTTASTDAPVRMTVSDDIPAGDTRQLTLRPGACARIMTGAPLPDGADAVVPVEITDGGLEVVTINEAVSAGSSVRHRGEDVQPGDTVIPAGTLLLPRHVPVLASAGLTEVAVVRRPRVAVVSTGDELLPLGERTGHGQIVDSNGPMLAALVAQGGFELAAVTRCGDTGEAVRAALTPLADSADAIITTGGVSAGAFEPLKLAFEGSGSFDFVKLTMQPGKPQGFGIIDGTPVFALPGNPVSSLVSFLVFVAPALRAMAGRSPEIARHRATVGEQWQSPPGRTQFARVVYADNGHVVRPIGGQGSHVMGGLAGCQALAIVPAEVTSLTVGDEIEVISLEGLV